MLTPVQAQTLSALYAPDQVLTDPVQLITYELDAGTDRGKPDGVVLPRSAEEVRRLARWARQHQVPLTPRGSGTGYAGGAVPWKGGIVVGFSRMNAILEIDAEGMQAVVQPGVISDELVRRLAYMSLCFPPDPASLKVCSLGGMIAQNAGGPHCLKYGVTGNYVLGVEVVLADGRLIWLGGRAYDAPEYGFADLVVGSEGTLGLVTEAVLRLRRQAQGVKALTVSFASVETAGRAVSAVIGAGLMPATIELMDGNLIAIVDGFLQAGLPTAGAMLIMDVEGYPDGLDSQLEGVVRVLHRFDPIDIRIARTAQEREQIWLARRSAGPAVARIAPGEHGIDVSVPRSRLADTIVAIGRISQRYRLQVTFLGHAGDGNLHPTWPIDPADEDEMERLGRAVGEILLLCAELGGSISGEHGVGLEKRHYLPAMYSPAELGAMLDIKELFDQESLLNPGKIFPSGFQRPVHESPPTCPTPGVQFSPSSAIEAAEGLRSLQATGRPAFIGGGTTKWLGSDSQGSSLTTARLRGTVTLDTDDLYVTAPAGTPFDDLQAQAIERGFWVPLANPWPGATVGGMISSNVNGPLRALYGSVRDYLLAVQVALPDGRLLRFGRPLMKDVAGYQMAKLFVGAFGTLGLLTEASLRLVPLPLARKSLVAAMPELEVGLRCASGMRRATANCSGLVLVAEPGATPHRGDWRLVCTVEGHPSDVAVDIRRAREVLTAAGFGQTKESEEASATDLWELALASCDLAVRAAVPPAVLPDYLASLEPEWLAHPCVVDLPGGMLTVARSGDSPTETEALLRGLRAQAEARSGYAAIIRGPRQWLRRLDAWGTRGPSVELMRGLKTRWDPAGILNRGEFGVG